MNEQDQALQNKAIVLIVVFFLLGTVIGYFVGDYRQQNKTEECISEITKIKDSFVVEEQREREEALASVDALVVSVLEDGIEISYREREEFTYPWEDYTEPEIEKATIFVNNETVFRDHSFREEEETGDEELNEEERSFVLEELSEGSQVHIITDSDIRIEQKIIAKEIILMER